MKNQPRPPFLRPRTTRSIAHAFKTWRIPLVLAACATLAGCASLDHAGHASYTVKRNATGGAYELEVRDGKEFAGRRVEFAAQGDGAALSIIEGPSKAFAGQAISAKAATVLPVGGLSDLLK